MEGTYLRSLVVVTPVVFYSLTLFTFLKIGDQLFEDDDDSKQDSDPVDSAHYQISHSQIIALSCPHIIVLCKFIQLQCKWNIFE